MRRVHYILAFITVLAIVISLFYFSGMPDKIATHWNASGAADGYMSKFPGLFILPIMMIIFLPLFMFLPSSCPLKDRMTEQSQKWIDGFFVLLYLMFFILQMFVIIWNIGTKFNPIPFVAVIFSLIFFYLGFALEKICRNSYFGIRTPWTLASEKVWDETHKKSGILFKIVGIIGLFSVFYPKYAIYFIVIPILITLIFTFLYSQYLYKKQVKEMSQDRD